MTRRRGSGVFRILYTKVEISPHTDLAPMVPVRLRWKGDPVETDMMMDTGATVSVLPPTMAARLELELGPPGHPGKGLGGEVAVRPSKVRLQLAAKDTLGVAGRDWLLEPVLVAASDEVVPVPILGRRPFLQHYELIVREDKGEFVLREL